MEEQVAKRHFLRHLYIKCIILPRQARDKHRENSKKNGVTNGLATSRPTVGRQLSTMQKARAKRVFCDAILLLYVRSGQNSTGGGGRRSEHESRLVALPRLRVRADHALTRAEVSAPALA